jgi:ATP-dependent Clp protease ATP-binding subunit ClpA
MGVLREEEGLAARVLASLDVEVEPAAEFVKGYSLGAEHETEGQVPLTPRTRKALELSLREALSLGHNYIGTEHVLLGILREGDNNALAILENNFKLTAEKVRGEVIRMLSGPSAPILRERRIQQPPPVKPLVNEKGETEEEFLTIVLNLARAYPDKTPQQIINAARVLWR